MTSSKGVVGLRAQVPDSNMSSLLLFLLFLLLLQTTR